MLWKAIIRPPRSQYVIKDLGPYEHTQQGLQVVRTDLEIKGARGHTMQCSHFEPEESLRDFDTMPCVIYMHGNSSCRAEALNMIQYILSQNMTLFCFDFVGCGKSEGEYVSLGWYERDDLRVIIDHLRKERKVSSVGLWGRSMGAATALMHGKRDPTIAGMVLDSSFADLKQLVHELAATASIPKLLVQSALALVKASVESRA